MLPLRLPATGVTPSMKRCNTTYRLLSAMLAAACLAGCFGSEPPQRGKLSEAVEKASDDNDGDRKVSTPPSRSSGDVDDAISAIGVIASLFRRDTNDTPPQRTVRIVHSAQESTMPASPDTTSIFEGGWISITGGVGATPSDAFATASTFGAYLGGSVGERGRIDVFVGFDRLPIDETSALIRSLNDDLVVTRIGIQYRYMVTPPHTALGFYLVGGGGFSYMGWTYRNAITSGTESIGDDAIDGLELYTGVGVNFLQTSRVQLGLEALPGVTIWSSETKRGFENDVFEDLAFVRLRATASFRLIGG